MKITLPTWSELGIALILVISLGMAFGPSLHHAPRQDQWFILQDTLYLEDFSAIWQDIYSYSRTRTLMPTDSILFRPVLFSLLAAEQSLFGRHFVWWQLVGIWLHLGTVYLLYRLTIGFFRCDSGSPPNLPRYFSQKAIALVLALFFGLNMTIIETVIWSHINGYILFTNFLLAALLALLPLSSGQQVLYFRLGIAWICLLLASFTYELGQVAAILVAGVLMFSPSIRWQQKVPLSFAFAVIVLLYQGVNYLDYRHHFSNYPYPPPVATGRNEFTAESLLDSAITTANYLYLKPFFPSTITVQPIVPQDAVIKFDSQFNPQFTDPIFYVSAMVFVGWIALLLIGFITGWRVFLNWLWGTFLGGLTLAVLALITIRNATPTYDHFPTHNIYIGLLLFCLTSIFLFSRSQKWLEALVGHSPLHAGLGIMLLLSLFSGARIYRVNQQMAEALAPLNQQVDQIAAFIKLHEDDPSFSMAPDLTITSPFERYLSGVPMPLVFFWQKVDYDNPQYILTLQDGQVVVETPPDFQARTGRVDVPPFPRFIEFLADFMLFDYQGSYWAVYRQDPYYDPQNANGYDCLLNDPSLDSLRRRVDTSWYMRHTDSAQKAHRGLSPEHYAAYQEYESPLGIDPEAIIFNPSAFNVAWPGSYIRSSLDMYPLEILLRLGQQIEDSRLTITKQADIFDLMTIVEQMEYDYTVALGGSKAQALQDWRRTKAPEDLQRAGIEYLALDSFWLSYTTEAEYNTLFDPQQYRLVAANIPYEVVVPGCFSRDLTLTILQINR